MKFNTRLLLCAAIPALLFVAALGAVLWGLVSTQAKFSRYIGTEQAVASGLTEMYAQGLQMGQALRNVVLDTSNKKALENFGLAETAYDKAFADTQRAAKGTPAEAALLALPALRSVHAAKQKSALDLAKTDQPAATKLLIREETPAWRELRTKLLAQIDASRQAAEAQHADSKQHARQTTLVASGLAVLAVTVAASLCWLMRRTVARELGGDPATAREALRRIADGDLRGAATSETATTGLMGELQRTRERLQTLVSQVRASSDSINTASAEIATGNQDLSGRTEQAASNLQQAASSMEQLTVTVSHSADSARQANQMAASAAEVAQRGGAVVTQVVSTMDEINASSKKIADIVGVIDGIAFQTNILALNAAVEAARAGEQGRGFAVVASEVRSLAQRSAQAAKEIKVLIGSSVGKVEAGSRLVADAGSTMHEIVASVQRVTDIIGEITAASGEQSSGIGQVNMAVNELDRMTQQNAALVEQSAAAAMSLQSQAQGLAQIVSNFKLGRVTA